MKFTGKKVRWLVGGLMALATISLLLFSGIRRQEKQDSSDFSTPSAQRGTLDLPSTSHAPLRERKERPESDTDRVTSNLLRDQLEAGELSAIQKTLADIAGKNQLHTIRGVLKNWCRDGTMDVALWSLSYSESSDPDLNLILCAEAMKNPSDTIRELASARLEVISGIRFSDPVEVQVWLGKTATLR
jgi:hypothetical protein